MKELPQGSYYRQQKYLPFNCGFPPKTKGSESSPLKRPARHPVSLSVYPDGVRLKFASPMNENPEFPTRVKGDIKGWSSHSKRAMQDFLVSRSPAAGLIPFSADLTIPPLEKGNPRVTADLEECRRIWTQFKRTSIRRGLAIVWRMEIQPRTDTRRPDVRGKEQPHWHLIGASPTYAAIDKLDSDWLSALRDRGKVKGAAMKAANVNPIDGWTEGRKRYLLEHSTKKKAAQVASGWGRHWGVIGRHLFIENEPLQVELSPYQSLTYERWAKHYLARRVPDRRAFGGLDWDRLPIEPGSGGSAVLLMGSRVWCPGWDGSRPAPRAVCVDVCRALGKQRKNVWATKKSKRRVRLPAVQHGAGLGKIVNAVMEYCKGGQS